MTRRLGGIGSRGLAALTSLSLATALGCGAVMMGCGGDDTKATSTIDGGGDVLVPDSATDGPQTADGGDGATPDARVADTGPDVGAEAGTGPETSVDAPPAVACATPSFLPGMGTYGAAQSVKIATTTAGATIYYTANGTNPTTGSQVFDPANPISVAATATLRAICTAPGFAQSAVAVATYTITIQPGTVSPPSFSSPNGATTQNNDFLLGLTTPTAGATICFAFNQSHPTCMAGVCGNSTQTYGGTGVPISGSVTNAVTGQVTVNALGCMAGSSSSTEVTETYTLKVATPSFNGPAPATLGLGAGSDITPLLSSPTLGAVTAFANPTASATPCTTGTALPGTLPKNVTIHATGGHQVLTFQACKSGYAGSDVYSATYDFKLSGPSLTPPGNPVAGSYNQPVMVSITNTANASAAGSWTCTTNDATVAACGATANTCAGTGTTGATPTITANGTKLSSVACAPGFAASDPVAGGPYTLQLDPVTFDPPDGTNVPSNATPGIQVTIAEASGAGHQPYDFICWTDDGTTPDCVCTASTHVHNAPGQSVKTPANFVTAGMTLKARGCLLSTNTSVFAPSPTGQATYNAANTTSVPSVTPVGANFTNDTTVTIKNMDALAGELCYTADGTAPACNATKDGCTAGVAFAASAAGVAGDSTTVLVGNTNTTVTAIACTPTKVNSGSQSQTYTLTVAAPVFDIPGGQVPIGTVVNWTAGPIAAQTAGASFAFTTDGTTPLCNAAGMTTSFTPTVAAPSIKVVACKPNYAASNVVTQAYTFIVKPPTLTPDGSQAAYGDYQSVVMTDPVSNGNICYTINGAAPGCLSNGACAAGSTSYVGAQLVNQSGTLIRAVACVPGLAASTEVSGTYTLKIGALSFAPNPADAQTTAQDITVALANPPATPYVLCTDSGSGVTVPAQSSAPGTCASAASLATYLNAAGNNGHVWTCTDNVAGATILMAQATSVQVSAVACKDGLQWSTLQAAYAFNPYARTFQFNDGVNRFVGAETLASDTGSGFNAYMSWDATNLVFGFAGFTANDGSTVDVYFGDGVAGTTIPDENAPVTLPALNKNALYHLVWNDTTAQASIRRWDATSATWQATTIPVTLGYSGGGSRFVEFGVARAAIGSPSKLVVVGGLLAPGWPATGSTYTTVWPFPPNTTTTWTATYSVDFAATTTPAASPVN